MSFGGAVARDHDLLLVIVEFVEGVEELFLGAFLAGQDLDVVDQQHVGRAVVLVEVRHAVGRMQVIISFMKRSLEV